jgi:hypothetical protein
VTIIKNWEPVRNSLEWENVVNDSEGPDTEIEPGRIFYLTRNLTDREIEPLFDMEQAIACDIEYGDLTIHVDQPLIRIIHHYLNSLE